MGYCITYENGENRKHSGRWVRVVALVVGFLLGCGLRLRGMEGGVALGTLAEAFREGIPEAVEVFCRAVRHG